MSDDFIEDWMQATESAASPEPFRLWTGISLVGAAVERRCWIRTTQYITMPNMYIWLVAAPGVGKQVLDKAQDLVRALPDRALRLAPDSVTKASFIDALLKAKVNFVPPGEQPLLYHSLYIIAEEIQLFLPEYASDMLGVLNRVYGNPARMEETRRTGMVKEALIPMPQINMLAGVQPGWMAMTLPELAWSTGLMTRVFMVYVENSPIFDFFAPDAVTSSPMDVPEVVAGLTALTMRHQEFQWQPSARERIRKWNLDGGPPAPTHSKLVHYNKRRAQHLTKLALISALSRRSASLIEDFDLTRGMKWMIEAEALMPDVFRAMVGKSDQAVLEELHHYLTARWKVSGNQPVPRSQLLSFLTQYGTSDKIHKILQVAEEAGIIAKEAGTEMYRPRPKHLHGME